MAEEKKEAEKLRGKGITMTEEEREVIEVLESLHIPYELHHHNAIFGKADAEREGYHYPGFNVKNLVLYDKKTDAYYMVVLEDDVKLDLKRVRRTTGWSNKITFAGEEQLMDLMKVAPGSCSIFGIIKDKEKKVQVVLTDPISNAAKDKQINFHPNINTATVSITIGDMFRFLEWAGNRVICE